MPDPETPPPPPQQPQQNGPWWFRPFMSLFSMNAEQQRGAVAMIYMTAFLAGGGWLVYYLVTDSRRAENERTALFVRAFESENEKNRQSNADLKAEIIASNRELTKELGGLRQQIATSTAANEELKRQVQNLGSMIGKLESTILELRKKLPPSEINLAPMPKLHDAIPLTGPVIG